MNLSRCEKGHFYDKEKFATCPHCAGGSASDEKLTQAFTSDVTVPMEQTPATPPMPVAPPPVPGIPPVAPPPAPSMPSVTPPPAAAMPIPGMPPVAPPVVPVNASGLPIPGMGADQITVPFGNLDDSPTVPLKMEEPPVMPQQDMEDDHTVGFFDIPFAQAAPEKKNANDGSVKPVVNKVSTPCVGWLVALGGEHIGTDFRLKVGKNFIGRDPKMDVALTDDKSVSRERHAIVVYEPKAHLYLVQPGESSSLVYRNNEVVLTPVRLAPYDMITVGDVNLLFMPLCGEQFNWGDLLGKKENN